MTHTRFRLAATGVTNRHLGFARSNGRVGSAVTILLLLLLSAPGGRTLAQTDACSQAARIEDQRAQDYRRAARDVGRNCPSPDPVCPTTIREAQQALTLLFDAHQTMIVACGSGGTPPPPPPAISPTIPGDLVISEIMMDPSATADAQGEWFEIYNPTSTAFNLAGLIVRDDGSNQFTISGSLIVPAGELVVLGNNGDPQTNGGLIVDYVYTNFSLSNLSDQIEIFNGTVSIDRVAYGSSFPISPGHSIALGMSSLNATANDLGSNWCASTMPFGSGDAGSPHAVDSICQ